jgi:hypothetical protein
VISISKVIDWKIALFAENFLDGNVTQIKKFPIINQRDDKKICDLKLRIENSSNSFQFTIESSPVSLAIFFAASVDFLNSETSDTLDKIKFGWTEYESGQEIRSSKILEIFSLLAADKNLIFNVRCEVTSKINQ